MVEVKNSLIETTSKKGMDYVTRIKTIPKVINMAISPDNIKAHSINLSTKFRRIFFARALLTVDFVLDMF